MTDVQTRENKFADRERLSPIVASGTATQPQRIVLTDCEDIDKAQASGRWISAIKPTTDYE